jgi:hypothetical protein
MPSQRLIRHQSLLQRISSYPQDLLLSLNETYELLEWDTISDTFSIPIGVALNIIYLLARLDQHDHTRSYHEKDIFEGSRIPDPGGVFGVRIGGVHTLVRTRCLWLMLFSCTLFLGVWWVLALRIHCIVLRKGRIIVCLMRNRMCQLVLDVD